MRSISQSSTLCPLFSQSQMERLFPIPIGIALVLSQSPALLLHLQSQVQLFKI